MNADLERRVQELLDTGVDPASDESVARALLASPADARAIAELATVDRWLRDWPLRTDADALAAIAKRVDQRLDDELAPLDVTGAPVFDDSDAVVRPMAKRPRPTSSGAYSLDNLTGALSPPSVASTGPSPAVAVTAPTRREEPKSGRRAALLAAAAVVVLAVVASTAFFDRRMDTASSAIQSHEPAPGAPSVEPRLPPLDPPAEYAAETAETAETAEYAEAEPELAEGARSGSPRSLSADELAAPTREPAASPEHSRDRWATADGNQNETTKANPPAASRIRPQAAPSEPAVRVEREETSRRSMSSRGLGGLAEETRAAPTAAPAADTPTESEAIVERSRPAVRSCVGPIASAVVVLRFRRGVFQRADVVQPDMPLGVDQCVTTALRRSQVRVDASETSLTLYYRW